MIVKPEELLRQTRLARRHLDKLERHLSEALGAAPHVEKAGAAARDIQAWRRRRTEFVAAALFAELAWDMLLALYIAQSAGDEAYSYSIFRETSVSPTTGGRFPDKLEAAGLFDRTASALRPSPKTHSPDRSGPCVNDGNALFQKSAS